MTCKSGNGPCWTKRWTYCWTVIREGILRPSHSACLHAISAAPKPPLRASGNNDASRNSCHCATRVPPRSAAKLRTPHRIVVPERDKRRRRAGTPSFGRNRKSYRRAARTSTMHRIGTVSVFGSDMGVSPAIRECLHQNEKPAARGTAGYSGRSPTAIVLGRVTPGCQAINNDDGAVAPGFGLTSGNA